jgi:hypothetical protein
MQDAELLKSLALENLNQRSKQSKGRPCMQRKRAARACSRGGFLSNSSDDREDEKRRTDRVGECKIIRLALSANNFKVKARRNT